MSLLKVSDAFCYICRGVLIKPVTSPCQHSFCFACFEQSMQETSYSCPLCRRRISNWVRTATKAKKLINVQLWEKIQQQFAEQVHAKLRGEDDGLDEKLKEECPNPINVSGPGEVAKEYSKLMKDYQNERDKVKAAEELASKEYISKLTEQEERHLKALKRQYQQMLAKDEELARKLHSEMNEAPGTLRRKKTKETSKSEEDKLVGPMDKYVDKPFDFKIVNNLKFRVDDKPLRSASSDSVDSIQAEMHHFKPIKVVPRTPPKITIDGPSIDLILSDIKPLRVVNVQSELKAKESVAKLKYDKKIHSPYSAFIGRGVLSRTQDVAESPRKRLRPADESEGSGVLKEITLEENSDSNSMGPTDMDDNIKRKRSSPVTSKSSQITKKSSSNDYLANGIGLNVNSVKNGSAEENENSDVQKQFDTHDYVNPEDLGAGSNVIEEQKRIEEMILQEKNDRELAMKLNQEWQGRYELRNKPKGKGAAENRNRTEKFRGKKLRQTVIDRLVKPVSQK